MLVSIAEAAVLIGVAPSTLRRWEAIQKLLPKTRTVGGHRRYCTDEIAHIFFQIKPNEKRETIAYARVSSHDQKEDLERQKLRLQDFCTANHFDNIKVLSDLGSGMNYKKKGLRDLLHKLCSGSVARLVLTHRDRLLRFGSELIFALCKQFGTEVILLSDENNKSFEEQLSSDLIEIITVFTSKVYGKRAHDNRKKAA